MTELVITVPEGMEKKEWFTTSQFAKGVQSTPHAINQWVNRHPDFSRKYCQNISNSKKRVKWLINWEGIAVYLSSKNSYRRNPQPLIIRALENSKENIAKMANEKIKSIKAKDPFLESLLAMVEMRENQLALESKVDSLEKRLIEATTIITQPIPVTATQRQFLNERVNKYCIKHDLPYHAVWRQIHRHVGLVGIHQYEYKHYAVALKYIRKMYEETGLAW